MSSSGERSDGISNVASRVVPVVSPALGSDWTFAATSVAGLLAVTADLNTSAVVANRNPRLRITDGLGHTLLWVSSSPAQTATQTVHYSWAVGGSAVSSGQVTSEVLPSGIVLPSGATVGTLTVALDAGDQWSNIVLTFSA